MPEPGLTTKAKTGLTNRNEYPMTEIHKLLARDALADAEVFTGQSYKEDKETASLGFGLHMLYAAEKESALQEAKDSYFNMDLAETLALYADMGFTEILCDEFKGTAYSGELAPTETFRILWHTDGLLATVESYQGTRRNSTKVYYNLDVADRGDLWSRISSGGLADGDVWVGDHDAREGIRTNLARLSEVGTFLPTWVERPFLWLVTYAESKGDYDYKAINAERISRLPESVQAAIAGGAS